LINLLKAVFLLIAFLVIYIAGVGTLLQNLPDIPSDPGAVIPPFDILIFGAAHVLALWMIIRSSTWWGWKLAGGLAFSYYGIITIMSQIETWYFLSDLTVGPETLRGLFLMGLPPALIFVPLAVLVLSKWKKSPDAPPENKPVKMPLGQWVWKMAAVAIVYIVLYYSAGYFIAYQNPALRAFYGLGEYKSFLAHTLFVLESDPGFVGFQLLRGLMWGAFALPVIWMCRRSPWQAAFLVAFLFSVPFNIGHIMPNPLIPDASVRMTHLLETASSNFVFGLVVVWLLHRKHNSLRDLFGLKRMERVEHADRGIVGHG